EMPALEIAQKAKEILDSYNKLFKQKIDYGISLDTGEIVAKKHPTHLEFMSMGAILLHLKKVSTASNKMVLLSEKIRNKLASKVKTQKHTKDNLTAYSVKEVIHKKVEHKKFITEFIKRLEEDNKKK
ncbi:hypothetical protein ACFLZJ_02210, partial [Nanoarchaeota archaeon]